MSRRRTPQQWREIIDAFHRSGLSQAEFSRQQGIHGSSLQYHLTRAKPRVKASAKTQTPPPRFVELIPKPDPSEAKALPPHREALRLELTLPVGLVTILGEPTSLAELIRSLTAPSKNSLS